MYKDLAREIWDRGQDVPRLLWEQSNENPLEVSVSLVCLYRKNVGQFFYDMITRWLIPEMQIDIQFNFSARLDENKKLYSISQIILSLDHHEQLLRAEQNFPFLEKEILIGVQSLYHATRILEMKGMTFDDKRSLVQSKIGQLVGRFPAQFDYDIFPQMQRLFIGSKESFKALRQPSDLAKVITTLYHFRRVLKAQAEKKPKKRHVHVKLRRTVLHTSLGHKEVVSIFLGINFLREHELFEERHLLSAISHLFPGLQSIPDSSYYSEGEEDWIQTFYLEVEKENRKRFTFDEINQLQKGLAKEIANRIEQLVPPIFMPRNEEEVIRNVLALSSELKYLRDLPQMMISFDEQTDTDLCFTVVIVRIAQEGALPFRNLLEKSRLRDQISIDRIKVVGRLRRKYPKEACVFRVRLSSDEFLREDYSVDLFRARLELVGEMEKIMGEIRDYNGGIIAKQSENFLLLKNELGPKAKKHALLLQNFFHCIFPATLSSTTDPKMLKLLFSLLLQSMESNETISFKSKISNDFLFTLLKFQDFSWKQRILHEIERLNLPSNELLSVHLQVFDSFYLGFILFNSGKDKQKFFLDAIPEALSLTFHQNTPYLIV